MQMHAPLCARALRWRCYVVRSAGLQGNNVRHAMFRRALFALLQLGSTACATTVCTKGPCGPGNGAWATLSCASSSCPSQPNIAPVSCRHLTALCVVGICTEKCVGPKPQQYVFHLSDETCAINDPNGPFYDEVNPCTDSRASRPSRSHAPAHRSAQVHGMYHNFYQDHLAEPQAEMGPGRGPDWGHWISRDFLHWARLPVAIWNDQWYRQQDLLLLRWYAAIH